MTTHLFSKNSFFASWYKPRWYFLLITLLGCMLLASLGVWQLHRAHYKRELMNDFALRPLWPAITLATLIQQKQPLRFRRIILQGHYDNANTFFLENQFYHHKVGAHIITPFIPSNQAYAILVDRGWIAKDTLKQALTLPNTTRITGLVSLPPQKTFYLGDWMRMDANHHVLIQSIDRVALEKMLKQPLVPYSLLLLSDEQSPVIRDWRPQSLSPERHLGYALQWFALAATLLVIYLSSLKMHVF